MKSVQNLKRDHDVILHVVFALERACSRQMERGSAGATAFEQYSPAGGGKPGCARELFARAARFLQEFGDRYHAVKEETFIFPRLVRAEVDAEELRREHEEARRRLRCLAEALVGEQAGGAGVDASCGLAEESSAVVGLLRTHIRSENDSVLPALEKALSDREDKELARCLEEFEEAVLGPNAGARYHDLAHELVDMSGRHHH